MNHIPLYIQINYTCDVALAILCEVPVHPNEGINEAETRAAIDKAITDLEAEGIRDMGRVMAALKERHAGQMDFGAVGPAVKDRLLA